MKIFFIRHTEAEDDLNESFGGICDDRLVETGRNYAKKVANLLRENDINLIFTSPYSRAIETAKILNEELNVEIVSMYNLRERNTYGVLSGITKEIAQKKFAQVYNRIQELKLEGKKPSNTTETLPGAEVFLDLILRIKDAFEQIFLISSLVKAKNISIITHGGVAWAFFNYILKEKIELEKGEIIVLEGENILELSINTKATEALKAKK